MQTEMKAGWDAGTVLGWTRHTLNQTQNQEKPSVLQTTLSYTDGVDAHKTAVTESQKESC